MNLSFAAALSEQHSRIACVYVDPHLIACNIPILATVPLTVSTAESADRAKGYVFHKYNYFKYESSSDEAEKDEWTSISQEAPLIIRYKSLCAS